MRYMIIRYEGCFSTPRGRAYSAEGKPELSSTCRKHRGVSISSPAQVSRLGGGTDWGRHNTNTAARCRRRQQEQLMWKRWRCRWCRFGKRANFWNKTPRRQRSSKTQTMDYYVLRRWTSRTQRSCSEWRENIARTWLLSSPYLPTTGAPWFPKIYIPLLSGLPQVSLDF